MQTQSLPSISIKQTPQILFLGNGINRQFEQGSWDDIINDYAVKNITGYKKGQLKDFPATMQIVMATGDKVDKSMVDLAKKFLECEITDEQICYNQKLLRLPFEHIITTNYSYELELAVGGGYSVGNYRKQNFVTNCDIKNNNDMNLYQYTDVTFNEAKKHIWHIHGQLYKPKSIIMGHYYYGKLVSQIQNHIPHLMAKWNGCKTHDKNFNIKSWVDLFIFGDVHIIGFGMDLSEMDIWWLACCKKRNAPNTKIYFYTPDCDISKEKELLMKTYGIEIVKSRLKDRNYKKYYQDVLLKVKI